MMVDEDVDRFFAQEGGASPPDMLDEWKSSESGHSNWQAQGSRWQLLCLVVQAIMASWTKTLC
jgi:hypothetical protein